MDKNTDLYRQAKQIVLSNNNYSISFLQRSLQISYNKASELMRMIKKSQVKEETSSTKLTSKKVTIIGMGEAGGNILSSLHDKEIKEIELIAINTDTKGQLCAKAHKRLLIGTTLSQGLGTNMHPSLGREAAFESYEDIKTILQDTDMLFLIAGLGGGTGSGATPVIAKIAKEMGILVISIVTKPFSFEGKKRLQVAETGLTELKKYTNSLIVIPNDNLLPIIDKSLTLSETFMTVDNTIIELIYSIFEALYSSAGTDINLSFEDLQTVFQYKGKFTIAVSEKNGVDTLNEAIREAMKFPLCDDVDILNASCILLILKVHPNYSYGEMQKATNMLNIKNDISVILAILTDSSLDINYVRVTLIATGFNKVINEAVNNTSYNGHKNGN